MGMSTARSLRITGTLGINEESLLVFRVEMMSEGKKATTTMAKGREGLSGFANAKWTKTSAYREGKGTRGFGAVVVVVVVNACIAKWMST